MKMKRQPSIMSPTNILDIENLEKHFPIKQGIFKGKSMNRAVDRVTFAVKNEEMFGLVGY